ncbi:MAG: hypothetical protein VX498_14400, partial [Myxococcota bacterium]|nr:hypothetical protein [Myxococcota bacterium]
LESRRLLVPELIERDEESVAGLLAQQDSLARRGLDLSDFGGGTLAVHAGPVGLAAARVGGALSALLDRLEQEKGLVGGHFDYELDALLAWFGAIAPTGSLDRDAMEVLVTQLDTVDRAFACPHGQPVLARLSREEVEGWFQPKP